MLRCIGKRIKYAQRCSTDIAPGRCRRVCTAVSARRSGTWIVVQRAAVIKGAATARERRCLGARAQSGGYSCARLKALGTPSSQVCGVALAAAAVNFPSPPPPRLRPHHRHLRRRPHHRLHRHHHHRRLQARPHLRLHHHHHHHRLRHTTFTTTTIAARRGRRRPVLAARARTAAHRAAARRRRRTAWTRDRGGKRRQ